MRGVRGLQWRRAFHASSERQAIHKVNVPSMGDSISEGTLVEIVKKAGDSVHADEVVVVLETDKVSVDVTSPIAGTVVEVFAGLEENVEVGKPLFTLDDSMVPSGSSTPVVTTSTTLPDPLSSDAVTATAAPPKYRVPLIKFLGKRSMLPSKPLRLERPPSQLVQPPRENVMPFTSIKRLPLSPAEVESINTGLAYL